MAEASGSLRGPFFSRLSRVAFLLGTLATANQSFSATFTVTNLADSGTGSLRHAIGAANAAAGGDLVVFQTGLTGTITLSSGALSVMEAVEIHGPGSQALTIDGSSQSMLFAFSSGNTEQSYALSGMALTNGFSFDVGGAIVSIGCNLSLTNVHVTDSIASGSGGGLYFSTGSLSVENSTFSGNLAESAPLGAVCSSVGDVNGGRGGGIYAEEVDAVTITDVTFDSNGARFDGGGLAIVMKMLHETTVSIDSSVFTNNIAGLSPECFPASGGGLFVAGMENDDILEIDDSTISGNTGRGGHGGGLLTGDLAALTMRGTTISGNDATNGDGGGALLHNNAATMLENVTIVGNTATARGGGLMVQGELAASTIVRNSTVSGNGGTTGGIHALDGPTVTIRNSIVANSTDPASTSTSVDLANDGSSSFHVAFSNVEAPGTSAITSGGGNLVSQDPNLGPLQNNGGPTETMMPNQGSPVIDAGDPAFSSPPSEDQRGFTRVVGGVLDMGAVEFAPPPGAGTLALTSATYVGGENAGSIVVTVKRTGGSTGAVSVGYATSDGSATAGADYTVAGGTLSWTAGQSTPKAFSIPITNDSIFEGDEILTVTLSNVTGGASLGTSQAEVTIDEDEATPTLTINDVLLPEGNSGTTTFAFTVTLAPSSASVVTVNFATAPGSAGAGDYIAGTGTLSFAAGVTAQVVNVAVLGDGVGEYNETFTVGLNSPTNATIADETGVGTIQNDDPPAMPGSFSATATATNVVTLVWTASPGATSYVVERQTSSAGSFGSIASPTTNGYADTLVSAATTYRYRVRALNAYGSSSITSPDLATTVLFTDSVLSGVQAKAVHLAELRAGVNAVRAFSGRAPASFTGGAAGQAIGAIHLTEVRSALDAAAPDAGLATGGYTDSSLAGVAVKAVHFEEIRSRVK